MMANKSFVFRFADVEVREREFSLIKSDESLPVEPKAFRVLLILLRNPKKLITKEELLNAVWGDAAVTENSLTRSIALLRRLLGDDTHSPRFIETVATVGYRFVCKVEVSPEGEGGLEPQGESNGTSRQDSFVNTANGSAANFPAPIVRETGDATKTGTDKAGNKRFLKWLLPVAAVLLVGVGSAVWYTHRPLPLPSISEYLQITHDGHRKILIGTDGTRLYFNQIVATESQSIAQVGTSGGEIQEVSIALQNAELVDVSMDGSTLLAASSSGTEETTYPLWSVRIPGGSLRHIADAGSATFSPDGKLVAYSSHDDLFVVGSDGTNPHKLASLGGLAEALTWSPDGSTIRFTKNARLWEVSSSGLNLHQLLPTWSSSSWQCCGHWTADERFFVFLSGASASWGAPTLFGAPLLPGAQIWALDERRHPSLQAPTKPIKLTSGPTSWGTPIPSKDGKKIFARGVTVRGELVRFDSHSQLFQPFLGGISAEFVSFSNDGQAVAYVSYPDGILWRANLNGGRLVQLSDPPFRPFLPRWSPDGTQILFTASTSQDRSEIHVVSSEGGGLRRLLPGSPDPQFDPNWSPDGRKIVFSTGSGGGVDQGDIRILDLRSHEITTLPGSKSLFSPRWSPDGKFIAALSFDSRSLRIFNIESRQWSVRYVGGVGWPAWSRDSQFVYFAGIQDHPTVSRVSVSGKGPELVVDLKDFHSTGLFGLWLGLDPTDAPLLLRDIGSDDIYALTLEVK